MTMQQRGFDCFTFSDGRYEHAVFIKGSGPPVIVMHELPGFAEPLVGFADRLVNAGFRVYAPHLFGPLMWEDPTLNYARLCISKEFGYLRANRSAPICDWLRALANSLSEEPPGTRIGVIGMCLTGAFVIPMVIEPGVRAGVISQPAIPISLRYVQTGRGEGDWMREMNISDEELREATERCARDHVPILVERFLNDRRSTHARVERIAQAFGSNATVYEYKNPGPGPYPHAILTSEYDLADGDPANPTRVALQRVIAFLTTNLAPRST
ncbi:dienelactone hydrolase family protein [Caballeronia sp. SEWSISQ10-4 2]|uniref:dienelactone hydrolase family protein n=1 Tax=Caballeronia sp. SEWSISQ10-4 2 TaxID=2937438 RepID=UPI002658EB51|nr:dienelactone hydrolase family protein [Caballeronia sp. SEWSISQ10-4 2]